jgi:addiction module HigA family antidote
MKIDRVATTPGEVLREEFMVPYELSASALARALDVPTNRITEVIAEVKPRGITTDTALRLARYFGTTPQLWLNLQMQHDLTAAVIERGGLIEAAVQPRAA